MAAGPVVFTYEDADGMVGTIPFQCMRRLWVDRDCLGMEWIEPGRSGDPGEPNLVSHPADAAEVRAMEQVMCDLLDDPAFAIVENPPRQVSVSCLVLEFRYPSPHAIYLAAAP